MRRFILIAALLIAGCDNRPCIGPVIDRRIRDPYTTFIWSGKVMIPIFHPEEYLVTVERADSSLCDVRVQESAWDTTTVILPQEGGE